MHPVGIKFGLNLLQFQGGDVVIADRFFEEISAAARRRKCALPSPLLVRALAWARSRS